MKLIMVIPVSLFAMATLTFVAVAQIPQKSDPPALQDAELEAHLGKIVQRIADAAPLDLQPITYETRILRHRSRQAYIECEEARATCTIFITSRMLAFVENADELAGVIAHEMAHGAFGHQAKWESAERAVNPQDPGAEASLGNLSRQFESEADSFSIRMLNEAGYSPTAYLAIFPRLPICKDPFVDPTLSTHPKCAERIAAMQREISALSELGASTENATETAAIFAEMKKRLNAVLQSIEADTAQ